MHDRPEDHHLPRPAGSHHADDAHGDDGGLEAVVETVKHGIDQVADKVKGLLRSGR